MGRYVITAPTKTETSFGQDLNQHTKDLYDGKVLAQKHSSRFHAGVADWEFVFQGVTTWVELKVLALPQGDNRGVSLIGKRRGQVSPMQVRWLHKRYSRRWYRHIVNEVENPARSYIGINCWVVFFVSLHEAIVLSPPELLQTWTKGQLVEAINLRRDVKPSSKWDFMPWLVPPR